MFHRGVLCFFLAVAAVPAKGNDNNTEPQKILPPQGSCGRGKCLTDVLNGLRGNYQIIPGVNISSSAVVGRSTSASEALATYLKSLTLHVALYNEPMYSFFGSIEKETGRGKRPSYHTPMRFRFLSLYTVFAVAFALLSALVGKAVTLSVIALVIAAIAAGRGLVGFGLGANSPSSAPPPVLDFVRRPHVQVQHIHTAEEVYEPGTSGGGVNYMYPARGRAVPLTDSYRPNEVHVISEPDSRHVERHIHTS